MYHLLAKYIRDGLMISKLLDIQGITIGVLQPMLLTTTEILIVQDNFLA